jgi:outer membrane protein, heavy metal efflux system
MKKITKINLLKDLIKINQLIIFSCIVLSGCNVNTNPNTELNCIKQKISEKTGFSITTRQKNDAIHTYVKDLLKNVLNEDLAIKITLLNNLKLQAAYEQIGFSKANLAQSKLLKNPIFSLSYKFATKANQFDIINMNLFQNFLETILIPAKKTLASVELEKTKEMVINQILQVIATTKIAFYKVLFTELSLKVYKKITLAFEAAYEFSEILYKTGNITALEVSIKKADYNEAKIFLADLEVALISAKEDLNKALGLYGLDIIWKIEPKYEINDLFEVNFDNFENRIIAQNIALKNNQFQMIITAKKYGINITKTIVPNFLIGPDSEREDNGVWFLGPAFSIGIPIFDFGKAISAAAEAKLHQLWNNYNALAIEIRSTARMTRINFLNSKRKLNYYQNVILPLKEKIHGEAFEQYNAMQIGVFDLLRTKIAEFSANIERYKILNNFFNSKINLDLLVSGAYRSNED